VLLPALSVAMGVGLLFLLLDWRLALVGALVWPLVLIGPRIVTPRAAAAAHSKKSQETALLGSVEEAIGGYRVIKSYGLDAFMRERFQHLLAPLSARLARATFLGSLVERSTVIAIYAVQFLALALGANMAFTGALSVGAFIAFLTIFWSLGWSIVVLARSAPSLISAAASMQRLQQLLAQATDPLERAGAHRMPPLARSLALHQVQFSYAGRPPVLKAVSLAIRQGEFVALVGPSGSGKSSILNVVSRQYGVDSGRIEVDGRDMDDFTADSIRAQMGFVFQESTLFNLSVRENIRLGLRGASDEQVEAAARAAEVHDAIQALPQGYATNVGERGALLSGGQRQRVAIARALIRNPSLLLLDEATSALDPVSEAAINETLLRARAGRTLLSVTHRLDSAMQADRILVVDAGAIVETGTHHELLARNGLYADLWRKQHGFHVSRDGSVATVTADRLRDIRLLSPLSDAQREALLVKFVCERVPAGQTVIRQGERGDLFYLLVRGTMVVTLTDAAGQEREFARLADGDEFGEMALLYDQPRNATITARTDCLVLSLTQAHFTELLESTPAIREQVEKLAAERSLAGTGR
jgi:ATP-binding cassette subfamily B protein